MISEELKQEVNELCKALSVKPLDYFKSEENFCLYFPWVSLFVLKENKSLKDSLSKEFYTYFDKYINPVIVHMPNGSVGIDYFVGEDGLKNIYLGSHTYFYPADKYATIVEMTEDKREVWIEYSN